MNATSETFQPVDFSDVIEGDRLSFVTNDNGYGGRGVYERTGHIQRITANTVTVACVDGTTATLRRSDWRSRSPKKDHGEAPVRRPRDAAHVQIVHEPGLVTALYIPDPEMARNPRAVLDAPPSMENYRKYEEVETVATAERHYRRDGADFTGWIVSSGNDYGDPIPNKKEALEKLHLVIADYFTR